MAIPPFLLNIAFSYTLSSQKAKEKTKKALHLRWLIAVDAGPRPLRGAGPRLKYISTPSHHQVVK